MTGRIGVGFAAGFDLSVFGKYEYRKGWSFGGSASGFARLDLFGSGSAFLLKATAYGGIQGVLSGEMNAFSGDLSLKLFLEGVAGVTAQYRSLFGGWENLASIQFTFLRDTVWKSRLPVGKWIKQEVDSLV